MDFTVSITIFFIGQKRLIYKAKIVLIIRTFTIRVSYLMTKQRHWDNTNKDNVQYEMRCISIQTDNHQGMASAMEIVEATLS